jgi:hypothetical protein
LPVKLLQGIGKLIAWGVGLVKGAVSGVGGTAETVVVGTIATVGGRKMFLALLTMFYVPLCFYFLKMPTELILAGLGPLLAFIGVEGARDYKAEPKG